MITNRCLKSSMLKKGTVHVHTDNSSCGHYPSREVINLYFGWVMDYDFIALTDHMVRTPLVDTDRRKILISGEEFKRKEKQILGVNINDIEDDPDVSDNHQAIIDRINEQGGVAIICHPHLYRDDYWSYSELMHLDGYSGIEIYNHNEKMNNAGRAIATDLWDRLLASGKRIYGYSNDDMHHSSRVGGGYMRVEGYDKESIINSLRNGTFYSSIGLDANSYMIDNDSLKVEFDNKFNSKINVRIIIDGNIVDSSWITDSWFERKLDYKIERYIRVEAMRDDGAYIWFQPSFLEEEI